MPSFISRAGTGVGEGEDVDMSSDEEISQHLRSTIQMIKEAFPSGVGEEEAYALVAILYAEMSTRALAETFEILGLGSRYFWYNEILGAEEYVEDGKNNQVIERVKNLLIENGFYAWRAEEP